MSLARSVGARLARFSISNAFRDQYYCNLATKAGPCSVSAYTVGSESFEAWLGSGKDEPALLRQGLDAQDLSSHSFDELRSRSDDIQVGLQKFSYEAFT